MTVEFFPEPGESWVFDPAEAQAWGPFVDDADAERFIESDKYLRSWAVIYDGSSPVLRAVRRHPPSAYYGVWPVSR